MFRYVANRVLNLCSCDPNWSDKSETTFVDHQQPQGRKRFLPNSMTEYISKTCLQRKDFQIHAQVLHEGIQIRIAHNKEEDIQNSKKEKQDITQIRHIQRHSFIHKNYIRFDASKIIQTSQALYDKQEPCAIQNEIELELINLNPLYMQTSKPLEVHAESMICKILDIACMIHGVKTADLDDLSCKPV